MPFLTIFTVLFYPYIAHERTTQNLILSVRSVRFALSLKERHRSQNEGSLKREEQLSDFKERCAQLCLTVPKILFKLLVTTINISPFACLLAKV